MIVNSTTSDLNLATMISFKKNWVIGKLLGLDVSMDQTSLNRSGYHCFVKIKNENKEDSFILFEPTNDWRICGLIIEKYGMRIDNDPRQYYPDTSTHPWNWCVEYKNNNNIWMKEWGVYNIKETICRAFMGIDKEKTKKLIDEANKLVKGL